MKQTKLQNYKIIIVRKKLKKIKISFEKKILKIFLVHVLSHQNYKLFKILKKIVYLKP